MPDVSCPEVRHEGYKDDLVVVDEETGLEKDSLVGEGTLDAELPSPSLESLWKVYGDVEGPLS